MPCWLDDDDNCALNAYPRVLALRVNLRQPVMAQSWYCAWCGDIIRRPVPDGYLQHRRGKLADKLLLQHLPRKSPVMVFCLHRADILPAPSEASLNDESHLYREPDNRAEHDLNQRHFPTVPGNQNVPP